MIRKKSQKPLFNTDCTADAFTGFDLFPAFSSIVRPPVESVAHTIKGTKMR